jgi:hypothetical protein
VFKKFFGKKNDGFYLQIEDDKAAPKAPAKAKAPATAPAPAKSEPVAAAPVTAPSAAPAAPAAKTDKKSAKAGKQSAKADKQSVKKAEAPKASPVAVPVPTAPAITSFASDYLIKPSSISSRRLPGANMSGFLDMARQVKKPVNIK